MNNKLKIGIIAIVLSLFLIVPATAGQNGKSNTGHQYLYEKVPAPLTIPPTPWEIVDDGAWGKMKYNLAGPTFDYVFNGHGLEPNANYTVIYYPDKNGNPWPRTDIICLGAGTANGGGNVHIANSVNTNSDLPTANDINAGAKIWAVKSDDVNCSTNTMFGWNPTEYLFEGELINFEDTT